VFRLYQTVVSAATPQTCIYAKTSCLLLVVIPRHGRAFVVRCSAAVYTCEYSSSVPQRLLNCDTTTFMAALYVSAGHSVLLLMFISHFFLGREIFEVPPPITAKLCNMIGNECSSKTTYQNCIGDTLKFVDEGAKKVYNSARFRTTSTLIANIPGTEQGNDDRKTALQTAISPA